MVRTVAAALKHRARDDGKNWPDSPNPIGMRRLRRYDSAMSTHENAAAPSAKPDDWDNHGFAGGGIWAARVVLLLASAGMIGGIVWAAAESGLDVGLRHLFANRWGIMTLLDVYAGGLCVALWLRVVERHTWRWCAWVLGLLLLGNLVALLYLTGRAFRARTLPEIFMPRRA